MPFPNPDTQFKPGQTGNPAGHSRGRRVSAALARLLEDSKLSDTLALTIFAAAVGDPKLLKGRKPDVRFMQLLLDRTEGRVAEQPADGPGAAGLPVMDAATAARVLRAINGDTGAAGGTDGGGGAGVPAGDP